MTSDNDSNYWSSILPDSPSKSIRNRLKRERDKGKNYNRLHQIVTESNGVELNNGERYGDTRQTTTNVVQKNKKVIVKSQVCALFGS